jgi:hypothetical protein
MRIPAIAIVVTLMLAHGHEASAQAAPGAGVPQQNTAVALDPTPFRYTLEDRSARANELAAQLPAATIGSVLDDADRNAPPCQDPLAMLPLPTVAAMFCWEADDAADESWWPQGITTSADAFTIATYQGETVIMTSWYHKGSQGSRVSLIDYADPANAKYRHVLLVQPKLAADGTWTDFEAVPVHAGGIAWYGDLLYVVDTGNGFRVFDMRKMLRVQEGAGIGRQPDDSYRAHGHKYVLPQTHVYRNAVPFRHSYISLDRTSVPDSVVVGEYQEGGSTATKRIIRIPIDSRTRLLGNKFTQPENAPVAVAEQAFDTGVATVQGGTAINGTFLLSASGGGWHGTLYTFVPGALLRNAYLGQLPHATEDLSYWAARDQLWTLAEVPGYRAVVAVRASAFLQ